MCHVIYQGNVRGRIKRISASSASDGGIYSEFKRNYPKVCANRDSMLYRIVINLVVKSPTTSKLSLIRFGNQRILISEPFSVFRKPFVSLARMVTWPDLYWQGDFDPDATQVTLGETDREQVEAQAVVTLILEHNGIELDPIHANLSDGWSLGGDPTSNWQEKGEDRISIPDLRRRYSFLYN